TVIVSPTDDRRTIKAVLAVSALLQDKGVTDVSVNAIISKNEYRFPPSIAEANHISTLQTNTILTKMIAHSCTQTGLSETFREVFNFEGSEFYLTGFQGIGGLTFEEVMVRMNHGVPAGVLRGGKVKLNPPASYVLEEGDELLVFAEEDDSAVLLPAPSEAPSDLEADVSGTMAPTHTMIFGHNESLPVILRELPENVSDVYLVGQEFTETEREQLEKEASGRGLAVHYDPRDPNAEETLLELAKKAEHIVILNDHDKDAESSDMEAIFLLLNLRDIRTRYGLRFNITVEMQREHNQNLVGRGDHTDFLVASSMSSLILSQLAESPALLDVFREILSNTGNELYLKSVGLMKLTGAHTVRDLRRAMLRKGYILLGYLDEEKNSRFNLPLDEVLTLKEDDHLIVLGEK
ncbi:MAG: hypothetical protein IKY02_02505, partial [Lachnospiraceae bacterium]|nr:hypothetical protein [Lachnospiraceae bacterium]